MSRASLAGVIEYDLLALKRALEARGLECDLLNFPDDYWSRDFRITRSNLLIRIPAPVHAATEMGLLV
ncbi:MAG: hypothetical protein HY726_20780 [Candidatus Rokubacteria bacterium]|nr:hypothetical protein [Candidatus Rokubacteria bacterium]